LTDEDQNQPQKRTSEGSSPVRLSGNFTVDFKQPEAAETKREKKNRTFLERLEREIKRPRFWIEIAALIVGGLYTYQAREANKINRKLIHGTLTPLVTCSALPQREVPTELYVILTCANVGQNIAEDVQGTIRITTKAFPEEKTLASSEFPFGGGGTFIKVGDPKQWSFPLDKFAEAKEMPLIHTWKEIIVIDGEVRHSDGVGGTARRPFCQVYTNYELLKPDMREGIYEDNCEDTLLRLRTALKHKNEADQSK
jgi:hypothetical protein